jgi:hypothetical protein
VADARRAAQHQKKVHLGCCMLQADDGRLKALLARKQRRLHPYSDVLWERTSQWSINLEEGSKTCQYENCLNL